MVHRRARNSMAQERPGSTSRLLAFNLHIMLSRPINLS